MTDATRYYKATTTAATSFYDKQTTWKVGRITRHPKPDLSKGLCSKGVLHASDAPGETLIGGSWPCRLFVVEPRSSLIGKGHKFGAAAWKVTEELPGWQTLGPNGEAVVAFIEAAGSAESAARSAAWYAAWSAWYAARSAAWYAAESAARSAAWYAAWSAAESAAGDAAGALVVRDLITDEQFHVLAGPWEKVMGPL